MVLALLARSAAAQDKAPFELTFGGSGMVGLPLGDFADVVGTPWGFGGYLAWARPERPFGLRIEATALIYGSETRQVPVGAPGLRQSLEVTTDNWMGTLGAGPQFVAAHGAVRPYVTAFAGVSYFATDSEVRADDRFFPVSTSTNYDDTVFAWGGGVGVFIPLGDGHPGSLAVTLGARFVGGGKVRYLAEGDIVDRPGGGVAFVPRETESNRIEFHIGIAGLP
jgi:hypothetical protein